MTEVVNSIAIRGSIEPLFDVVTTTKHWPAWHPATEAVSGVTERPLAVGDQVVERAVIGGQVHTGTWTVTEREPPTRLVLQIDGGRVEITYRFTAAGTEVLLERVLRYEPRDFAGGDTDPDALAERMRAQSATALQRLKPLVEHLLGT